MSGKGDPTPKSRETAIDNAIEAGHRVIYGDAYTLLLDLDSDAALAVALDQLERFRLRLGVNHIDMTRSPGDNVHLYVRLLAPMDRRERLFWQVALGSDCIRGALDWLWMQGGNYEECFLVELGGAEMTVLDV